MLSKTNNIKYLLFLLVISAKAIACSCAGSRLENKILNVEYIARIKVLKSKEITDYREAYKPYNVEIQTITQYKGTSVAKIYLPSISDASCGIYLRKDSEWIIFGYKDKDGLMKTNLCSDNIELNKIIDAKKNPAYSKSYAESVEMYLKIFDSIDFKKLSDISKEQNIFNEKGNMVNEMLEKINLMESDKMFGLYKLKFDADKKVIDVTTLNGFNKKIDKLVEKSLVDSQWSSITNIKSNPKSNPKSGSSETIIIIYHWDVDQTGKSKFYTTFY